jgi:hypothetical protein
MVENQRKTRGKDGKPVRFGRCGRFFQTNLDGIC